MLRAEVKLKIGGKEHVWLLDYSPDNNGVDILDGGGHNIAYLDNWVMFCGLPPNTGNVEHGTCRHDSWLYDSLTTVHNLFPKVALEFCDLALKQIYAQRQTPKIKFSANGNQAFTDDTGSRK